MKSFIKFFVLLIAVFHIQCSCYAVSIPVFCLFSRLEDYSSSNIKEYEGDVVDPRKCIKVYHVSDSTIKEYEGDVADPRKCIKVYHISGKTIKEYECDVADPGKCVKVYHLF